MLFVLVHARLHNLGGRMPLSALSGLSLIPLAPVVPQRPVLATAYPAYPAYRVHCCRPEISPPRDSGHTECEPDKHQGAAAGQKS